MTDRAKKLAALEDLLRQALALARETKADKGGVEVLLGGAVFGTESDLRRELQEVVCG